ncbi:MAG: glycosyltransferase family 39 protein [Bryobacteraceae bacterium]
MLQRRGPLVIWFLFLARAFFYCAALPLWEGYDEWAHFAVVQRMAFRGEPLVSRDAPVGRDIAASLELAPVPWECRYLPPPALTQDAFWRLPTEERARREARFRAIPSSLAREDAVGNLKAYEGLQGPLYGWLMTPLLWAAGSAHLATQVLLLRCFGVALVSLVIPLAFLIGRPVFGDDAVALGCAAIVAVMPEFLIDVARVGNDGIAVLLFTLAIWLLLEVLRDGLTRSRALALGFVLGAGLLAKAYFLTAIPPVAALLLWKCRRPRALLVPIVAFAVSGWWYIRNLFLTGTLTGMWESALLPHAGLGAQLRQIARVPWGVAIDSILLSHLYFGAWSSLTVRSWMYHLFYLLIALAAIGLVLPRRRSFDPRPLALLAGFFIAFWLGQLYHVIPMFTIWGVPTSMGCYLYAVAAAEVALSVAGLRALAPRAARRFVAPAGVALFALLDLYTIHMIAIPYYTGLIAHRPNGPLAAFHPAGASLSEMLNRLTAFKSPWLGEPLMAALWMAYIAATLGLIAISFRMVKRRPGEARAGV